MSRTTEDSPKKNSSRKSSIIKSIRSADKDMRDKVNRLSLFKVTFRTLRDLDEPRLIEIENWYVSLVASEHFKKLRRIYNENAPAYWERIPKHFEEHEKMRYRRDIFVTHARSTMPTEINPNV